MNLNKLVRPAVKAMKSYSSARDEFESQDKDLVFLDANENPFPNGFNRYPDPQQMQLKNKLAALKGLRPSQILCGNGSDEVLDLIFRAFCEPNKDAIITLTPTYGMYAVLANLNGIQQQCVSLTTDFQIDVPAVLNAIRPNSKLLFICSPNNPSGNVMSRTAIKEILKAFKGLVVIDEAYIDFGGQTAASLINRYDNLLVVQTMSKSRSLAGMRVGYAMGSEHLIEGLNRIKNSFNSYPLGHLQIAAAIAAFNDEQYFKNTSQQVIAERERVVDELESLGFEVLPSKANFILAQHTTNAADELADSLREKGIIVRYFAKPRIDQFLRITIGTESQNSLLIEGLKQLL